MKHFYSHIVKIETIIFELDQISLEDKHKEHLSILIDSMTHQTMMDVVLSNLEGEDHFIFLEKLKSGAEHKNVMDFLNQRVNNIEQQLTDAFEELKKELLEDLKEVKRKDE